MKGLIAAAGFSARLLDLCDRQNKVLLDLGGESILSTVLTHFETSGVRDTVVVVGHDAFSVRTACAGRARCVLNPFYEHHGLLGCLWEVRHELAGQPFVFTPGEHYFTHARLATLLADQPAADLLVDVELKACDDRGWKVYLTRAGRLRTISTACLDGPILGETTGLLRASAQGSEQLFSVLEKHLWQHGAAGSLADLLCHVHKRWELGFHLSSDHDRVTVECPGDATRAQEIYRRHARTTRHAG
jgi:choline kinase